LYNGTVIVYNRCGETINVWLTQDVALPKQSKQSLTDKVKVPSGESCTLTIPGEYDLEREYPLNDALNDKWVEVLFANEEIQKFPLTYLNNGSRYLTSPGVLVTHDGLIVELNDLNIDKADYPDVYPEIAKAPEKPEKLTEQQLAEADVFLDECGAGMSDPREAEMMKRVFGGLLRDEFTSDELYKDPSKFLKDDQ
jgi:hypothetical protein